MKVRKREVVLFLGTGLVLGYLVVQQINVKAQINLISDPKKTAVVAVEVQELIKNDQKLRIELADLENQKSDFESINSDKNSKENLLKKDIDQLKTINGTTEVSGPGVEVDFSDALDQSQVTDLVNALRNIGAEAIEINGTRIIASTGIDINTFQKPMIIKAIGKPEVLSNALKRRGGIIEQIGSEAKVTELPEITINKIK